MPPALSDDDRSASSEVEEIIPAKQDKPSKKAQPQEEEDVEEGDDDEFIVEKIVSHKVTKNAVVYDVKWQGYDNPADRTWEPEDNLDGAKDVLTEYWEEIGGRPEPAKAKKRKGRKSTAAESEPESPALNKRMKREREWSPPPGSWEHDVDHVETVEEIMDPKTGAPVRFAYLQWSNQRKTQHPLPHIYQKCPQKMLKYYENHLVFTQNNDDDTLNGNDGITMNGTEEDL